jgi:hypothetical protein
VLDFMPNLNRTHSSLSLLKRIVGSGTFQRTHARKYITEIAGTYAPVRIRKDVSLLSSGSRSMDSGGFLIVDLIWKQKCCLFNCVHST